MNERWNINVILNELQLFSDRNCKDSQFPEMKTVKLMMMYHCFAGETSPKEALAGGMERKENITI